jgi:hypothetical protein
MLICPGKNECLVLLYEKLRIKEYKEDYDFLKPLLTFIQKNMDSDVRFSHGNLEFMIQKVLHFKNFLC